MGAFFWFVRRESSDRNANARYARTRQNPSSWRMGHNVILLGDVARPVFEPSVTLNGSNVRPRSGETVVDARDTAAAIDKLTGR